MKNREARLAKLEQRNLGGTGGPRILRMKVVSPDPDWPEPDEIRDGIGNRRWRRREGETLEEFETRVEGEVMRDLPPGKGVVLIEDVADKTTGKQ